MIRIFFNPLDSKSVVEYPITPGTQLIQFLQSNYPTGFDGALRVFIGTEELDLIDLDYEVQETDNITMLVMPSEAVTWAAVGKIIISALVGAAIGYVINLIFAPKTPSFGDDQAESVVYTLSPTRNEARLGQPIASHYGTVSHPPAYASAPYVFYWDGSNDQYVDELLCLGQGKFEIQDIYIGDTPIEAIQPGTVKYWVFDADDHQQQVGRIGDTITAEVENTETPWPFHENVFTSPEVEDFQFSQEQNEENSTPVAISGDAYAAGIDPITGLYLLGRIEGVDDTLLISGGDTIELAGTTSNNIKFVVGSVAPTPDQAGKMTIFQQWGWDGPYIADELGLSGTFTTNVLVDGMTGGPFRVQKIGATVNKIDCDIVFPQGLFRVDGTSGNIKTFSVELEFTYQEIDETTGNPIGSPVVQNKTWTSKSRIPLRATVSSGLLPDGAYECSVRRVNPVSEDSRITDLVTWIGLKGYVTLDRNAEAYGKVSLIAFRLKASNGIATAARSRIRVVAKRILTTGQSDNPITVVKDIWANTDYGLGFSLSLLDPAMDDLETLWGNAQGPKFNGSYDQKSTGFDAMQSCVSMAGAKVVSDGQLTNVVPERIQQVRHAMFSTANIVRDSLEIIYTFDADGDFTGNVVEYRDPATFEAKYVYSPEETANPESFTLFGCTDEDYAQEMANYLWNIKTLRRKAVRFDTELEGLIPKFGQRIGISHTMPDWGQSGVFVESIDALTWMVDQPLDWTEDNIIIIRSETGLPSSPYTVTQGVNPNIVVFTEVPSIKNQQGQEPTSYAFGTATNIITDFIVTKVSPKGDNIVQIEGQLYNEEVYVDVPWQMNPALPQPPETLYTASTTIQGYGQDRLINVGATESKMLINPLGYGPLQWTDDGGATWVPKDFSANTSARYCQDMWTDTSDNWWILGYRPDNRADRSWKHAGDPDGTWTFTNNQDLSYNHGVYYQDANTFWRYDGNNNGPGVLRKYANQVTGTPATFTSATIPVVGQKNAWMHRRVGGNLFITYEDFGTVISYMVWDITADIPVYVGNYQGSLNYGRNMVSDGTSTCITTATAAQGGTSGNNAIIQSLSSDGTVTDLTMDFGAPVDLVCAAYENSQFIITAPLVSDLSVLRVGFGTSGTYSTEVQLPYPCATSDSEREVRYLGDGRYAIAYLALVGGTDRVLVVTKVDWRFV